MNTSQKYPEAPSPQPATGDPLTDTRTSAITAKKTVVWLYIIGIGFSWAALGIVPLIIANIMMYYGFGKRCRGCSKWWASLAESGTFLRHETKYHFFTAQVKDQNIHDASGRIVGYTSKDEHHSWSEEVEVWSVNFRCCFCGHGWDADVSGSSKDFEGLKAPDATAQGSPSARAGSAIVSGTSKELANLKPVHVSEEDSPDARSVPEKNSRGLTRAHELGAAIPKTGASITPSPVPAISKVAPRKPSPARRVLRGRVRPNGVAGELKKLRALIIGSVAVIVIALMCVFVAMRTRNDEAGEAVKEEGAKGNERAGANPSVAQNGGVRLHSSSPDPKQVKSPKNGFSTLAEQAAAEKNTEKALALWKQARGVAQNDSDAQLASQRMTKLSEQLVQDELERDYRALIAKAQAAFDSGSRDAAERYFKEALRIRPGPEAEQGLKRVQAARAEYEAAVLEAQRAEQNGDPDRASRAYKKALEAMPRDPAASRALDLLLKGPFDELTEIPKAHSGFISAIAFSTDGRFLASAGNDKSISMWSVPAPQKALGLAGNTWVHALAFSPDGRFLASGGDDRTVRLWDAKDGSERGVMSGHTREIRGLSFDASGRILISGDAAGVMRTWDVASRSELRTFKSYSNYLSGVALSADGKTAVVCSGTIALFDVGTGKLIRKLGEVEGGLGIMAISQDATQVAAATPNNGYPNHSIHVWNLSTKAETAIFKKPDFAGAVNSLVFSPDGRMLVSSHYNDREGALYIWDLNSRKAVKSFRANSRSIDCLSFSKDGSFLAGGTYETIKIWKGVH